VLAKFIVSELKLEELMKRCKLSLLWDV